ncbi:MAG: protein kinase [Myxococcales bacterium]|nr:protein kinase [Myxococcales bacterium]
MARDKTSPAVPGEDSLTLVRPEPRLVGSLEQPTRLAPVRVPAEPELGAETFEQRYRRETLLGEGGMGQVLACEDRRIGREVALKVIRASAAEVAGLRQRFLAEARIQGQLEHPSIVPVYDLGSGPSGPYFTMRRVRGRTLEAVLARLRSGDPTERYSRHRLLRDFVQLAQAVAFAHARGIIHRDLKPANTMLGDYGEVYVLDWGLAKQTGEFDPELTNVNPGPELATLAGAVVGTLGYMPPEQLRGEPLDARADVYALGAILFECLTLEPLHPQLSSEAIIQSTFAGVDGRPTVRAPGRAVPPEFDDICVRATALDPAERFASAHELAAEVDRWLNGDRDLALRKQLADDHLRAAAEELRRPAPLDGKQRASAIAQLNQAIALDPTHAEALALMSSLLLQGPAAPPPEALHEFKESLAGERLQMARLGAVSFSSWLVLSPLLFWPGIRSHAGWVILALSMAACTALCLWLYLRKRVSDAMGFVVLLLSTAAMGVLSLFLGPFMLVPALAAQNTIYFAAFAPRGTKRIATVAIGTLAVIVPFGLELSGVLSPSMKFTDGGLLLLPRLTELPATPVQVLLLLGAVFMVILPSFVLARMNDERIDVKLRLFSYLWHLRQLVPGATRKGPR